MLNISAFSFFFLFFPLVHQSFNDFFLNNFILKTFALRVKPEVCYYIFIFVMGQTEIRLSMPILFNWIFVILKAIGPNQYFFDYICFGSLSFVKAL